MSKVLVAMSGGVDSSVAAALIRDAGHETVGVTLKLWGGESDTGCCSVSDVEDARRVAEQLGIEHYVFNFTSEFEDAVVQPYVDAHASGSTPNPCVECNRHIKFDLLLQRAERLGFDFVATGHHARVEHGPQGSSLLRGEDRAKDQSYVLSMIPQEAIRRLLLPIGEMEKSEVREIASSLGLRTAQKPDSLEVCFISKRAGREEFLSRRIPLRQASLSDSVSGSTTPSALTFETVTIGQRKGIGTVGDSRRRYVIDKDEATATLYLGTEQELYVGHQIVDRITATTTEGVEGQSFEVQAAAHGPTTTASLVGSTLTWSTPRRRVSPGQTVAFYRGDSVMGSAVVVR